ncbi:SpoIIE family protein phosphatase [Leptospira kanakyensis]|uniref:Response regulator n=1 Tax=Leptospira kanakyensis TaxID=2484968 RepID=A0A6N4PU33_9LEPT|nr:response regulator [Leptospira kanakyensis]MCW7469921.1 SpoIIE family protein phosphatase [Leptospira kanakyensis]TGK47703.1 response regulator [Leptospira kanakyensis]TGK63294.1 response regulator [Leptospira kanakyensis]TGK66901.1 response regulator [Leptospira kanakyensis]
MSEYSFKPEILIIDDDTEICETLELIINGLGYFVRYFTNPLQGLEYFEGERNPIVFLDVNMPQTTGLDLLPKIKAHDSKTQVLMMTGEHDIQTVVSSLYHRASDFILKPFHTKSIEAAISRAFEYYNFLKDKESMDESIKRDLRLAAKIQTRTMNLPQGLGHKIFSEIKPVSFVSGDFFQVLPLNEDRTLILMGDIEGHGVTSGLIAILMTAIHKELTRTTTIAPSELLSRLNRELCNEIGTHSMTAISIVIDHRKKKITYARGGHPFPLVFQKGNRAPLILQDQSGQILGILKEMEFAENEVSVETGDILFLYSDGLLASSTHPLVQTLIQLPGGENRIESMRTEITNYIQYLETSSKASDDISYLLLEI